jgi:methyl-accepting chemotaxis protein
VCDASNMQLQITIETKNNINDIISSINTINSKISYHSSIIEETSKSIDKVIKNIELIGNLTKETENISSSLIEITKSGSHFINQSNNSMKDINHLDNVSSLFFNKEIAKKQTFWH